MNRTYTHPSVLNGIAAGASWADPEMDPTRIDWTARRAAAAIPFPLVDGRPVNPHAPTGIRYGRNELGHWGEQQCADALVFATAAPTGVARRWIVLIDRADGHGWALPGGYVDPGESPADAAGRALAEETGQVVNLTDPWIRTLPARYVPDPRASDEAWMVTTPTMIDLGNYGHWKALPRLTAADDARRARWVLAHTYRAVVEHLANVYGGVVFAAHRGLIAHFLGDN
ncbi:NUDIX domain-containing protein [Salinispora arenicola]|uniref:NUDIX domain-containing protein n=1 Tax=Salinispora arenicola TaxID=168697 RepID=UPI00037E69D5|nr:NUDIX domain-containing protein [Salinispora arenicola]